MIAKAAVNLEQPPFFITSQLALCTHTAYARERGNAEELRKRKWKQHARKTDQYGDACRTRCVKVPVVAFSSCHELSHETMSPEIGENSPSCKVQLN